MLDHGKLSIVTILWLFNQLFLVRFERLRKKSLQSCPHIKMQHLKTVEHSRKILRLVNVIS
jgi:hypothetical protein